MANGNKWQMANGKWQMANGKWQMAINGKSQMAINGNCHSKIAIVRGPRRNGLGHTVWSVDPPHY